MADLACLPSKSVIRAVLNRVPRLKKPDFAGVEFGVLAFSELAIAGSSGCG
ncbi:hypothetical protein [Chitinibacter sp. ZOR0017]|uniref:hypothetical protein n=1 Tax=Chitinibacter sp. ZOR0017 TaxID=1339254 RepID=UPI0012E0B694|nr:hypothetical protein [Chitinibacter sp. ZOR0017]